MIICELVFEQPNPKNPNYSLHEVDFYAWIPPSEIPNHRLSLRKNLVSGLFEVYRRYHIMKIKEKPLATLVTYDDTGKEEIVFQGKFEEALQFANREFEKFHGSRQLDEPCRHKFPKKALICGLALKERRT